MKNYDHGGGHKATYFSNPSEGTTHRRDKRSSKEDKLLKNCAYSQLLAITSYKTKAPKTS